MAIHGLLLIPFSILQIVTNGLIPNTVSYSMSGSSNMQYSVEDVSNASFEISDDNSSCTIVVLGSSTAYGTGANPVDNSWVNLYASAIFQKNTKLNIVNLAYPGYTTL